jgi:tetratricopeptide (TPR) repeat protein
MGNGEAARQKYQYILKVAEWRGVAHARALIQTGDAYMAEAEYNKAHGFFERTFLGYSNFPEVAADAYLADAEVLIKLNDINSAKATLAEALTELKGSISDARLAEIQDKYTTL